ncbi:MAG TPA: hypothetical protein VK045_09970 [Ornithinicoccus sp.]|nr:hypothetical protein [Ornithinicoccus sp.]
MQHTHTQHRSRRRRTRLTGLIALLAAVGLATPALAVTGTIGNAPIDRTFYDTWRDFTLVDFNNPAPFDGYFTSIDYYAERAGEVRFVIVDSNDTVAWISDEVSASIGPASLDLAQPVGVTAGSNLGVYSPGLGVISYDTIGDPQPVQYEWYDSGMPLLGEALAYVPGTTQPRFYSMSASITASSPDICKNGGWEGYGYRNQGQCIASVVANENSGH